nr:MAG TPA: hypothetical protein [Caudoviricetes sp.]
MNILLLLFYNLFDRYSRLIKLSNKVFHFCITKIRTIF